MATEKLPVKMGLSTLSPMTRKQAERYARREMPADLCRAGFEVVVSESDPELHGGEWFRVSFAGALRRS